MVDIHHIPNIKDAKRLLENFEVSTGVAIALSAKVHRNIRSIRFDNIKTARDLLAREILHLRKYSPIPGLVLLKLIELNKQKYPESFKK